MTSSGRQHFDRQGTEMKKKCTIKLSVDNTGGLMPAKTKR